jgi:hypothetical protein
MLFVEQTSIIGITLIDDWVAFPEPATFLSGTHSLLSRVKSLDVARIANRVLPDFIGQFAGACIELRFAYLPVQQLSDFGVRVAAASANIHVSLLFWLQATLLSLCRTGLPSGLRFLQLSTSVHHGQDFRLEWQKSSFIEQLRAVAGHAMFRSHSALQCFRLLIAVSPSTFSWDDVIWPQERVLTHVNIATREVVIVDPMHWKSPCSVCETLEMHQYRPGLDGLEPKESAWEVLD